MKITTSLKIAGAVLASALATMAVRADLAINENVSLLGYAAGSVQYNKIHGSSTETLLDLDAAKIGVALDFAPVSATVSLFTDTGASEIHLLDAHISYDLGRGFTATAGRFLTYLGNEAFDIPGNTFITYGESVFGLFPSYQQGVRIEYATGKSVLGLSVVDSVYNLTEDTYYRGDGKVRDGIGVEGNFTHTEENWSLGVTLAYQYGKSGHQTIWDDEGSYDPYANNPEIFTADIWLERNFGDVTMAAEIAMMREIAKDMAARNTFYFGLMAKQDLSDKISVAGRVSCGDRKDYGNFWKLSVMPVGHEVSNNFSIRTEVSYTRYSKSAQANNDDGRKYEFFAGVQAVFKF